MTKSKFKAGKEFNTKWIIDWENWVFFFVVFNLFFQSTNWFRISYFNCKITPFIYAIREKSWKDWKILKGFCFWQRGFINRRVWILRNNLFERGNPNMNEDRGKAYYSVALFTFFYLYEHWSWVLNVKQLLSAFDGAYRDAIIVKFGRMMFKLFELVFREKIVCLLGSGLNWLIFSPYLYLLTYVCHKPLKRGMYHL